MKEHDKNFHFRTSQKHGQVQDNENLTVSQGDSDKYSKTSRKFDASRQLDLGNSMCLGRDMKTSYTEKGEAADNPHHILDDTTNTVADDGEEGESEDGERVIKLEKWQLKKLASAAEIGRRRVNIKSLAAEVGLDRSDILSFLRDPPPELLTAVLDETFKESVNSTSEIIDKTSSHRENATPVSLDEKKKGPHTSRPTSWYSQKRLRKEVVNTFELVYRRTKRPTNSMIQNIVELTHVPRRRILQWFEDRRGENVPKNVTLEKVTD
ncbi:hypothetical protein O6H91_16G079000 [Diphasiastrum complanatum]|nr:hypothetical protein O6H91_16G079000 [Diphasiastrum complanatum]